MSSRKNSDIDKGWAWLVLLAVYSGILLLSTSLYTCGVMYFNLLEYYDDDAAKTSLIGSLNSGLLGLLGPFVSVVMDIYSCRTSMLIGAILLTSSYVVAAFVDSVDLLILIVGVIGGVGNALMSTPFVVVLAYYFEKRRTFFVALSQAVIGVAIFVAPPFALALLHNYGLKGTFILTGGICAQLITCAMICKPSLKEVNLKNEKQLKNAEGTDPDSGNKVLYKTINTLKTLLRLDLLTNIPFVIFLLSTMTWNFMVSVCLMHLPNYMHVLSKTNSDVKITLVMTVFGVSNTVGRFLGAFSVNQTHMASITIHLLVLFVGGALTMSFPLYSSFSVSGFVFAGLAGIFTGIPNSLLTPITLQLVGLKQLSGAHGLDTFFCGIGYTAGGPIAGLLFASSKNYETSFMVSGAVLVAGSLLAILPYCHVRKHERSCKRKGSQMDGTCEQSVPMIEAPRQ